MEIAIFSRYLSRVLNGMDAAGGGFSYAPVCVLTEWATLQCTDWRGKGNTLAGAVTRGAYLVMKGDSHCGNIIKLELTLLYQVQVSVGYQTSI